MGEVFSYVIALGAAVMMPVIFTGLHHDLKLPFFGLGWLAVAAFIIPAMRHDGDRKGMKRRRGRLLASPEYFSEGDEIGHFLLKHGVGHKPGGSEIDTPLDYGDYYFLEALVRFRGMK